MNTTKKTILFLFLILFNGSVFPMFDGINKKMSTPFIISRQKQIAMAMLVPLTVTGCILLAQHKDDISPLLEKIPVPSEKIILAFATAAGMSTTYVFLDRFSPEQQFKLYQHNYAEIKKHKIIKQRENLNNVIFAQEAQSKENLRLQDFINNNFSDEVNIGLDPSAKVVEELCALGCRIKIERQRLKKISRSGSDWGVAQTGPTGNLHAVTVSEALRELHECNSFIKNLRGTILGLSAYREDKKNRAAHKKNKLMEQKINGNGWSSLVPICIQPFMLAFQIFLNRLGWL